jgi:anti-anti-sigma factor
MCPMKLEIYPVGQYHVIRVEEDLQVISELPELQSIIDGYITQGKTRVALCFTNASYIYSGAIAVLISCYKKLKAGEGDLCLIEPKEEIRNIFNYMGIDKMVQIYDSEDELPQI